MIMMESANITNNVINSSSRVVDTLRMCKHFNKKYCRNSSLQKLLNSSKCSLSVPFLVMDKFLCAMSPLRSYFFYILLTHLIFLLPLKASNVCIRSYGCETWSLNLREELRLRVFENTVLRRIFGPKRDEGTGEWRKIRNEELNELYPSPNIFRVIKSRRMGWTGRVARMGRVEVYTSFWWGNLKERDYLEERGVDGRIILR